jgi:co-chaperonin GroES (HSP10)
MSYSMANKSRVVSDSFRPIRDKVFVTDLESGETITKSGLIITDDNMKNSGIRPRWGRVLFVGPEAKDVEVGQWVLIEHGRWTQKIVMEIEGETVPMWSIEHPKSTLVVSDEDPRGKFATVADQGLTFAAGKR